MLKRLCLVLVAVAVVATSATLMAGPQATLILRNGDRIRCELVDLGGVGYTFRTGGQAQTIGTDEVALIEFRGGSIQGDVIRKMQAGRPFIVLNNGDIIDGRLTDIGGDNPLRLTVRTPDGNQDFSSNDVARVFLGRYEGMPAPPASTPTTPTLAPGGDGTRVPANPCWTDVGVYVRRGQQVSFSGSGEVQLSDDPSDLARVAGSRIGRRAPNAPLRGVLAGALIGRVGNSPPFGIGDQQQALSMPASGDLWLGINDDNCEDNRGEFRVRITPR